MLTIKYFTSNKELVAAALGNDDSFNSDKPLTGRFLYEVLTSITEDELKLVDYVIVTLEDGSSHYLLTEPNWRTTLNTIKLTYKDDSIELIKVNIGTSLLDIFKDINRKGKVDDILKINAVEL